MSHGCNRHLYADEEILQSVLEFSFFWKHTVVAEQGDTEALPPSSEHDGFKANELGQGFDFFEAFVSYVVELHKAKQSPRLAEV